MVPCATCRSHGLIESQTCHGSGSLLTRKVAIVKWRTSLYRKVSATSGAASVLDKVFPRAKGVQVFNTQAHQCTPAYFANSYFLNNFSSEVVAERTQVPPTARKSAKGILSLLFWYMSDLDSSASIFQFLHYRNDQRGLHEELVSVHVLLGALPMLRLTKFVVCNFSNFGVMLLVMRNNYVVYISCI